VVLGTAVDDDANLTPTSTRPGSPIINGAVGAATAGTITFSLYGPSPKPLCIDPAVGVPGNRIATRVVNVNGSGHYFASSGSGSGSLIPAAAGTYYWVAVYSGDAPNTLSTTGACGDSLEQVIVSPNQPTIFTVASAAPPNGTALGQPISDNATVGNLATPSNGTQGTITFRAYGPFNAANICTGNPVYTNTVTTSTGNGTYNSGTFTPSLPGFYNWIAEYAPSTGDVNNLPVAGTCNDVNEASLVVSTTITTSQFFYPNDRATITASGGSALAGTVRFRVWTNATCSGNPIYDSTLLDVTTGTGSALTRTLKTANTTAEVAAGSVYWQVDFDSSNPAHPDKPGTCGMENSTITVDDTF
jgi:hypothetical protein